MNEYIGEVVEENGIIMIKIRYSGRISYEFQNQLKNAQDINDCFEENLINVEKRFLDGIKTIFPVIDTETFAYQIILNGEVQQVSDSFKYVTATISLNIPFDFNYVMTLMNYFPYFMKELETTFFYYYNIGHSYQVKNHEQTSSHPTNIKDFGIDLRMSLFKIFTKQQTLPHYTNVFRNFATFKDQLAKSIMSPRSEIKLLVGEMLMGYQFNMTTWQTLPLSEKISSLRKLEKNIRCEADHDDVDFILNYINFQTKQSLWLQELTVNQFPDCKPFISFELVLAIADMSLRSDDRLSISLSEKLRNKIISNYYTHPVKKPDFAGGFQVALQKVVPSLGEIHISEESNCEKEIIFTHESTQKLLNIGIHLNAEYMCALKKLYNNTRGVNLLKICTEKRNFATPPRDIIKRINLFANAEHLMTLTQEDKMQCFGEEARMFRN